jgi:hypothetical protein
MQGYFICASHRWRHLIIRAEEQFTTHSTVCTNDSLTFKLSSAFNSHNQFIRTSCVVPHGPRASVVLITCTGSLTHCSEPYHQRKRSTTVHPRSKEKAKERPRLVDADCCADSAVAQAPASQILLQSGPSNPVSHKHLPVPTSHSPAPEQFSGQLASERNSRLLVPAALTSVAVHFEEAQTVNRCDAARPITSGCAFTYAIAGGSTYVPAYSTDHAKFFTLT